MTFNRGGMVGTIAHVRPSEFKSRMTLDLATALLAQHNAQEKQAVPDLSTVEQWKQEATVNGTLDMRMFSALVGEHFFKEGLKAAVRKLQESVQDYTRRAHTMQNSPVRLTEHERKQIKLWTEKAQVLKEHSNLILAIDSIPGGKL